MAESIGGWAELSRIRWNAAAALNTAATTRVRESRRLSCGTPPIDVVSRDSGDLCGWQGGCLFWSPVPPFPCVRGG